MQTCKLEQVVHRSKNMFVQKNIGINTNIRHFRNYSRKGAVYCVSVIFNISSSLVPTGVASDGLGFESGVFESQRTRRERDQRDFDRKERHVIAVNYKDSAINRNNMAFFAIQGFWTLFKDSRLKP